MLIGRVFRADLESAMKYYKEASLYTPENEKLIMR